MDDRLATLRDRLQQCSARAAHTLGRRIRKIERGNAGDVAAVTRAVERAEARIRQRREGVPTVRLDESLPIAAKAEEIVGLIRRHQVTVVCGETGSGKSTQLPLMCLQAGRGVRGMIGHTQPRRIAARTIASRLADELRTPLGQEVGFKVRFDDTTDPSTYIKVMTDGVLLAEMQSDRQLRRYDTIIIDEAHERSLNIDFLLGCLQRMLSSRPELRVVITSATIDPKRFSEHFGGAPIVEVSGRTYPVEVRYHDRNDDDLDEKETSEQIVDAVAELAEHGPGDVLVFLSGEREIRETAVALQEASDPEVRAAEVLPLYARLATKDQLRVFQPHEGRRIILATNIAETSVTVPGVHYVVDTGLARINRYHAKTRVQGLDVEPISQASANQRAGRCGRIADGVCIRLYSESDYTQRAAFTDPEILRSTLAGVVLRMKALKLGDPRRFPFLDKPSPRRIRDAYDTLIELGAFDAEGELTPLGHELAKIPIDPRLGRMILASAAEGALREVLIIVAALATRDPRERPMDARDAADLAHQPFVDESSDILTLLKIWDAARAKQRELKMRQFRKWCTKSFLSWRALREWEDLHRQLRRVVRDRKMPRNTEPASAEAVHRSILTGLLSNIGKRGDRHEYEGTFGTEFFLHPGSVLFEHKPRWVMAAEIARTGKVYARMVAPVRPEWIASLGEHLLERSHSQPIWDHRTAAPTVIERASLLGLALPIKRRIAYGLVNPVHAREIFLRQGLVDGAFRPKADFVDYNDHVISEVRRLEAKARRRDHESEAGARFDFFDRKVGAHVWSGKRFDRWRHKAEATQPDVLYMDAADLIVWADEAPAPEAYPDQAEIAGQSHHLEYLHDPGIAEDGVAIKLSLAAFQGLDEARHDWLVPGLVHDRALAMLRALPKQLRRSIGPAPQAVDEFLATEPSRETPLADALAEFVGREKGVHLPAALLRAAEVPPHLVPRVVVIETSGKTIAEGRDLTELRSVVAGEVQDVLRSGASPLEQREGIRAWDVGDLPTRTQVTTAGGEIAAFPALIDCEASVTLALLPDENAALVQHALGVRRLLAIIHRRLLRRTLRGWPAMGAMRLTCAALGLETPIDDEVALVAIDRACGDSLSDVRTRQQFEAVADKAEQCLDGALLETLDLTAQILAAGRELLSELDRSSHPAWQDAAEDIEQQLRELLPERFLSTRSSDRLRHLPRYLRAAGLRLQKLAAGGLDRDTRRLRELQPRWDRWIELDRLATELPPACLLRATLEEYRWMLEEYRVSLFAQELGTVLKVSAPRIDEQWQRVRLALREDAAAASLYARLSGA
ncbi:MAG: ATP-dependent RNA helicase HrpA [Planctomycetota bacterium]|nr:ATP-dependent RNA helicase HrpA [Planctomycetota bacterium]